MDPAVANTILEAIKDVIKVLKEMQIKRIVECFDILKDIRANENVDIEVKVRNIYTVLYENDFFFGDQRDIDAANKKINELVNDCLNRYKRRKGDMIKKIKEDILEYNSDFENELSQCDSIISTKKANKKESLFGTKEYVVYTDFLRRKFKNKDKDKDKDKAGNPTAIDGDAPVVQTSSHILKHGDKYKGFAGVLADMLDEFNGMESELWIAKENDAKNVARHRDVVVVNSKDQVNALNTQIEKKISKKNAEFEKIKNNQDAEINQLRSQKINTPKSNSATTKDSATVRNPTL
jgi:hypothetical protein